MYNINPDYLRLGMYSGLLPKGVTEDELSPEDEEDEEGESKAESGYTPAVNSGMGAPSTQPAGDPDSDSRSCSLPGISQDMWQKFQDLRKKKDEIKYTKTTRKRQRRREKGAELEEEPTEKREHQEEREEKPWDGLTKYFGVNDRFQPPACSKPPPKSGLEKSIEKAIAEGDIAKAEEMSDRLATREMAVKIAQAADCRDFVQRGQEREALRAARKRRKQIAWGFEAKQRWETKSNMGFM